MLSGKRFRIASPYYDDYAMMAADSGLFDIKMAVSKATHAAKDCKALSFDKKEEILKRAAEKLRFNRTTQEQVVKMTGMPIYFVRKHLLEET